MDIKKVTPLSLSSIVDGTKSVCLYGNENRSPSRFAVVIPTYKRIDSLKRAIESALRQTIDNYEIVIVDNNDDFSNDSVLQLIKEFDSSKIIYYKNKTNLGGEGNFNRGILLSKCDYFVLLHDDDALTADCLEKASKRLKGNRAVFNKYEIVYDGGRRQENRQARRSLFKRVINAVCGILHALNYKKNTVTCQEIFEGLAPVGTIGVMYNRESFLSVGGFNIENYPGTDFAVNINYVRRFGGYYIKEPLAYYHIGQNDSLTACKIFPAFNFEIRGEMMDGFVRDCKKNDRIRKMLYHFELKDIKRIYGIDANAIEEREVGTVTDKELTLFLRKRAIKDKLRFGIK